MNATTGMPLNERIADASRTMRKSERKVAALAKSDPQFVVRSTMAAVAAKAGVSEPTVMRFCSAVGFDGFQSFKLGLAQALAIGLPLTASIVDTAGSIEGLSSSVFDHTIGSLDRARRYLDPIQMERAIEAMLESQSLTFIGLGPAGLIALDAAQKATSFGVPCLAPMDAHQQFMSAAVPPPGSTFIVISNTGRTQSVIEVAKKARANGATVIGLTGDESPLLEHCDIAIIAKTFENTDLHTPTVSRLAGLVVIDILSTAVAVRRGPEHLAKVQLMKQDLLSLVRLSQTPPSDYI